MPELKAAGPLFTLGAAGEYDGIWLTSARIRGEAGIHYEGSAVLCHGLDVAVGIEAAAELEAALSAFLPSIRAQGQLFAAAGAQLNAQVSPNLFEKVGVSVDLHASAEASAAGRIGVGLDFQHVATLAGEAMPDVAYQIFVAFLNELIVEAGVWGRASFSAMAEAHLEANGTLVGDNAGFQIGAGAAVGWGGGTGWDFYALLGFNDPRRFYNTAVELISAEVLEIARRELPAEQQQAVALLELVLPVVSSTAYDLGEMAAEELLRPAEFAVEPFLEAFGQRLALYVLDRIVQIGEKLIADILHQALASLASRPLSNAARAELRTLVEEALAIVGDRALTPETALQVFAPLTDILELLAHDLIEKWRDQLALLWSGAVVAEALRNSAASAGIAVNILGGISAGASADLLAIPPPPAAVADAYDAYFNPGPTAILFGDVIDYLAGNGMEQWFEQLAPDAALVLNSIGDLLDLTLGDLVTGALRAAVGDNLTNVELYVKLRDFVKNSIDGALVVDLLPAIKAEATDMPEVIDYIDEVVEPVLLATSGFVFNQVDDMVAGMAASRFDPFNQSFKAGLSELVWMVFVRNVVFMVDVMMDTAVDALHDGFSQLDADVRSEPDHPINHAGSTLALTAFGGFAPENPDHVDALQDLLADLISAGAASFGPSIWTDQRRVDLRTLTRQLLERQRPSSYEPTPLQDAFDELADCFFVPEIDALTDLIKLLAELTADEFEVIMGLVVPAFEMFFLRLTVDVVETLEQLALDAIADVAEAVRLAWEALQIAKGLAEEAAAELERSGGQANDRLDEMAAALADPSWRTALLNQLHIQGMDKAEADARSVPGFDALPTDAQDAAVATARSAFDIAFLLVRPIMDAALAGSSPVADQLGDAIEDATSAPAALVDAADLVAGLARQAVMNGLADAGLVLPPELTIDDVEAAAVSAVVAVSGLRSKIEAYIRDRRAELDANQLLTRRRDDEAAARNLWQEEKTRQDNMTGGPITASLLSPAPLSDDTGEAWVYPNRIPLYARIQGGRPSYLEPGAPTRLFVALNGHPIPFNSGSWTYETDTGELVLRTDVSVGLTHGLNTIELTVVDGAAELVRKTVSFLANPDIEPRGGDLVIADDLSQFDAPGNDHANTTAEWVTVKNAGDTAASLNGLRVYDRIGHVYVFGDIELLPQASVAVHTGPGADTETDVYWGKLSAVWNNRGDSVYLVDAQRILVAELVY